MPPRTMAWGPGKSPSCEPRVISPAARRPAAAPNHISRPRRRRSSAGPQASPVLRSTAGRSIGSPSGAAASALATAARRRSQRAVSSSVGWKFVESPTPGPEVQMLPSVQGTTSSAVSTPSSSNGFPSTPWIQPAPASAWKGPTLTGHARPPMRLPASKTATRRLAHCSRSRAAQARPATPAPTMATSTSEGGADRGASAMARPLPGSRRTT
mmetsp:Transcript_39991/g.127210  ORF Transcript_39991/g.127210 Transcript_39991/m.127210 type:complete len:212 (-) Transcript_39991:17-652(-)